MPASDPKRHPAFVSYSSMDFKTVQELVERLQRAGIELFFEKWQLAPGREFQPKLVEGLKDSQSCVVLLGPNGLGPWQKKEIQRGAQSRRQGAGCRFSGRRPPR